MSADSINNSADDAGQNDSPDASEDKVQVFHIPDTAETLSMEKETLAGLQKLILMFERMHLAEYLAMLQNPRRMIMVNFVAGLARGFGFILGMTVLMGFALLVLSWMVDLPLVGKYIARVVEIVQQELAGKNGI